MKKFGLIGFPLTHSFSSNYFNAKFKSSGWRDCVYSNYPIDSIEKLVQIIEENDELIGLNVTIPYKRTVIPFLHELDPDATKIGAVNTIKILNGKLKGYNTDIIGFEKSLTPLLTAENYRALILGSGGASLAVCYVLKKMGIAYQVVSTKPKENQISYKDVDENLIAKNLLIVNCTPLGMYPNVHESPSIPYKSLTTKHILYDLVYNPLETEFLRQGKLSGAQTKNGLEMLELQAEAAWEIWHNHA